MRDGNPLRIHVGSGRIYLDGWLNTDLPAPNRHLAKDRPELVERWKTTDGDAYYARQEVSQDSVAQGPAPVEQEVCDAFCDVVARGLPCGLHEADEVLLRQVVEHWSLSDFRKFLQACDRCIAEGGILRIDVPDLDATIDELKATTDPVRERLLRRHLLGHRRAAGDAHYMGYSRERLRAIVESEGFTFVCEEPPLKDRWYPAFCLRFERPTIRSIDPLPWERIVPEDIPDDWVCAEIGPGSRRFWPRANVVMDIVGRGDPDLPPGAKFHLGDVCTGYVGIPDQSIDYLYAAHVLEHVIDPVAAVSEINRIAKAGVLEVPHPCKDFLFAYNETDHKWWVTSRDGVLRFERPDERFVKRWRNKEWAASMHRIMLTGPGLGSDGMKLRRIFLESQRNGLLNVVHRWEGELKYEVIE